MTKILVVNPNTTASMTETIATAARAVAAAGTEIVAVTSATGPASIEGFYDEAFAVPGLIQALQDTPDADAAIIACFDDTGLDAARSAARYPVVGICEAALVTAGQIAKRIGIVTTLPRSIVPLEELVRRYGFGERATVAACNVPVLDLEKPGSGAREKLEAEITRALEKGADAIVLGCAGMADLAGAVEEVRSAGGGRRCGGGKAGGSACRAEAHDVAARCLCFAGREEVFRLAERLCAALRLSAPHKSCRAADACRRASGRHVESRDVRRSRSLA
jgi:allantoin racemase